MDSYIIFAGIIEPTFGNRLLQAMANAEQKGAQIINLLFSSLGGNTQEGFTLATIIRNSKIPVTIHATNNIDSIVFDSANSIALLKSAPLFIKKSAL